MRWIFSLILSCLMALFAPGALADDDAVVYERDYDAKFLQDLIFNSAFGNVDSATVSDIEGHFDPDSMELVLRALARRLLDLEDLEDQVDDLENQLESLEAGGLSQQTWFTGDDYHVFYRVQSVTNEIFYAAPAEVLPATRGFGYVITAEIGNLQVENHLWELSSSSGSPWRQDTIRSVVSDVWWFRGDGSETGDIWIALIDVTLPNYDAEKKGINNDFDHDWNHNHDFEIDTQYAQF